MVEQEGGMIPETLGQSSLTTLKCSFSQKEIFSAKVGFNYKSCRNFRLAVKIPTQTKK